MNARLVPPDRVISLILGGGAGTRLFPLTKERAKPAVPLAGKYRLVDIPISLCINSGFKRIFLLTQYLSSSLHRHVLQSYRFDDYEPRGFIEILAATQSMDQSGWYQGTADAVRQNLHHFGSHRHDLVLILSGDQLYRMDYRLMLAEHVQSGADVTVAALPVEREAASGFGILQVGADRRIERFVEKPRDLEVLESLRMPPETLASMGRAPGEDLFLASMGIYVFNRDVLWRALENKQNQDFGKHIIPGLIHGAKAQAYIYQGYWEDIGTIKAFYNANLDLTEPVPQFNFFDAESPIYSRARFLPPAKLENSRLDRVVLSDGCIINNAEISRSVLGVRSRVDEGAAIRDSILMGADFFESTRELREDSERRRPCLGIGRNSRITGAIVDKNTRIGRDVVITNEDKTRDEDQPLYHVRDGIVIIPKGTVIPDRTRI